MDTEREMANVEFLSCPYLVLSALSGHMARYHQRVDQSSGARDDESPAQAPAPAGTLRKHTTV